MHKVFVSFHHANDQKYKEGLVSWAEKIKKITTDKELYEKASSFNFNKSLNYEASVLQYRRDTFYSKLKECVLMSKTL